ncbi:MAG: Kynureninase [Frankiales bacterium]|nr:Kynureninase [Frankiales bacterium]
MRSGPVRGSGSVHDDLLERRGDYPVLATTTYLANHTLGAMHRRTPERLAEYAALWAERGVVAWETWAPEVERVADLVGSLIGAPAGTTVMRQNVADLLGDLAVSLDWSGPRNRVVTSALEWPGSLHTWSQIGRLGGEAVVVPGEPDGVSFDVQRMVDAIDERTLLVECSHVLFRTSTIVDLAPVVEKAHLVGALVVVDGYQAAGTLDVDVVALGADVYLGGSVKYLSGGPGNGWMHVTADVVDRLEPVSAGWFGQLAPFAFDPEIAYAPGIRRFAGGTPGVPSAYAAEPAYQALADIGMTRVRERSTSLTQPLLEAALERGWTVRSPHDPARRAGHVTIDPGDSQRVHDGLIARGTLVDHRPGVGIRVSPHFYNSLDESLGVLDTMAEVLAER